MCAETQEEVIIREVVDWAMRGLCARLCHSMYRMNKAWFVPGL